MSCVLGVAAVSREVECLTACCEMLIIYQWFASFSQPVAILSLIYVHLTRKTSLLVSPSFPLTLCTVLL
jgi:hypothetical protein